MISNERSVLRRILASTASVAVASVSPRAAHAQVAVPVTASSDAAGAATFDPKPLASVNNPFIQYGVAFTTEFVAGGGALCSDNSKVVPHCILGSGAGLVFPRIGWRSPGHWYFGGAYEFSKQDASTLYLLPILQQLRAEGRYYFLQGQVWTPFLEGAAGVAGYGNEWTVDAYGPTASVALGVEAQISRRTVVGVTLAYRAIHFSGFTDSAGNARDAGLSNLVGLNLLLEARDPY